MNRVKIFVLSTAFMLLVLNSVYASESNDSSQNVVKPLVNHELSYKLYDNNGIYSYDAPYEFKYLRGKTYYVSNNGTAANSGLSKKKPMNSIARALRTAKTGDTILFTDNIIYQDTLNVKSNYNIKTGINIGSCAQKEKQYFQMEFIQNLRRLKIAIYMLLHLQIYCI